MVRKRPEERSTARIVGKGTSVSESAGKTMGPTASLVDPRRRERDVAAERDLAGSEHPQDCI